VRETGEAASALYEDMLAAMAMDDPFGTLDEERLATARFIAGQLKETYTDSVYANFAAMFLAKLAMVDGDYEAADKELSWVLENGVDDSLSVIVKTRLAQVKLERGEHEEALRVLSNVRPGEHRPTFEEVKGDIYLAMGNSVQARESYQLALNSLPQGETRPMLRMKLDDLVVPSDPVIIETPVASTESESESESESGSERQ
ncbi:MAG: tetratricopeptide repeat protein, partial [Pseudomonadales bacterium]